MRWFLSGDQYAVYLRERTILNREMPHLGLHTLLLQIGCGEQGNMLRDVNNMEKKKREKMWKSVFRSLILNCLEAHLGVRGRLFCLIWYEKVETQHLCICGNVLNKKLYKIKCIMPWNMKGTRWMTHTFSLNNLLLSISMYAQGSKSAEHFWLWIINNE